MAVIKHILNILRKCLNRIFMGNCCRRKSRFGPISVVLLGSEGAGKTEIGHVLGNEPRIDFSSTKGVRVYNVQSKNQEIKLTEIGGSDSVRGIWPHYYNDAFGIVFVIDCSLDAPFDAVREMLHQTLFNKHIRGKPLLIVANKQDIDQSIDIVDITYFFRINEICNQLDTPYLIVTSSMIERIDLKIGMDWLVDNIIENYKTIKNRMRFNGIMSPLNRFRRQRTSMPKQIARSAQVRRIRSAPSTFAAARQTRKLNGSTSAKIHIDRLQQLQTARETNLFKLSPIVLQHQ